MVDNKNFKNEINKEMSGIGNEGKNFFQHFFRDVNKKSTTKQILLGVSSGWLTGVITMKVGKIVAIGVGGSIILLQIASNEGYVTIDWNKLTKKANKLADKAEVAMGGEGPSWAEKADRFIDRKLDQAERFAREKGKKARKWYTYLIGDERGPKCKECHIFCLSFLAGVALAIGS